MVLISVLCVPDIDAFIMKNKLIWVQSYINNPKERQQTDQGTYTVNV